VYELRLKVIMEREDIVIRRLILEPAVLRGEQLRIECCDTGEQVTGHAGMADWDEPDTRVHQGVNAGATAYEEIVMFLSRRTGWC
jgi:hypothetical protein